MMGYCDAENAVRPSISLDSDLHAQEDPFIYVRGVARRNGVVGTRPSSSFLSVKLSFTLLTRKNIEKLRRLLRKKTLTNVFGRVLLDLEPG